MESFGKVSRTRTGTPNSSISRSAFAIAPSTPPPIRAPKSQPFHKEVPDSLERHAKFGTVHRDSRAYTRHTLTIYSACTEFGALTASGTLRTSSYLLSFRLLKVR